MGLLNALQYARLMLIFTMTMMYCISCPLITPFGLMFFLVKYYVDRHNLLFAYAPSKINQRVHSTAINFFVLAVVILQVRITTGGTWCPWWSETTLFKLYFLNLAQLLCHFCPILTYPSKIG